MTAAPPAVRRSPVRGILLGIAVAVVFVLVAVVVYAITREPRRDIDYLHPESGSPAGARAVLNVLRDQGVDVVVPDSLADLRSLDLDAASTTLVVSDYYSVLGNDQRRELLDLADRVVVMDPWDEELEVLAPGVTQDPDYFDGGEFPADCDLPAAVKAKTVAGSPLAYDISDTADEAMGCFAAGENSYAVVQTRTGGTDVVVVGLSQAFTNGAVLDAGNAAFALNLLGEDPTLVWYLPGLNELDSGDIDTPRSLTPGWVTPAVVLLLGASLAAGIWRGRRLGPLVAEKLPVVVRSNETMEGRARLYERARSREHALDALRIGTVGRLATVCGLPRRASVDEVIDAVAGLTGRDRDAVAGSLVTTVPTNDASLVKLSDDLLDLETETTRIARGR